MRPQQKVQDGIAHLEVLDVEILLVRILLSIGIPKHINRGRGNHLHSRAIFLKRLGSGLMRQACWSQGSLFWLLVYLDLRLDWLLSDFLEIF